MEMRITEYPGFCRRGTKRPRDEAIEEHVIINAKIYKWIFVPPDYMNHPLSGIPYIGQTMRSLEKRTQQHKSDARRDGKDCGLHALYVQHPDFWKIEIVNQKTFTGKQSAAREAASEWMDDREKALIKDHGGKLKDMNRKLKQTLNLTDGGQRGDPRKRWQSMQAKTRNKWKKVEPLFEEFYKEHGHVNVPRKKKKLGVIVNNIRFYKNYVTVCPEIKIYLEERNFIWKIWEERANIIKALLLSYANPNKKQTYVDKDLPPALAKRWKMVRHDSEKDDEINIGSMIHEIRNRGDLINDDPMFRTQLLENGFVMNADEEHGNIVKELMLSYANPNKKQTDVETNLPPALAKRWNMVRHDSEKDDEINIGQIISNIRKRGDLINDDPIFFEALIAKKFKMHTRDTKKHQERIAEKRELHRQKKENDLMGREDISPLVT